MSSKVNSTSETLRSLLEFFTDEGDWSYVMDYERCGIMAADVTHTGGENDTPWERKRIVIQLRCSTMYSVIRIVESTPAGYWVWVGDEPKYYTTPELFDIFKRHAQP
jgi:hypothetical protein